MPLNQCDCVIMLHKDPKRCDKQAKYVCGRCQDKLCAECSNQHHAHGPEHRTKLQERTV